MAKKRKNRGMGFACFMAVYAVIALAAIAVGLVWFWGYIEAYEASRPHVAIDAYLEKMTKERIVERCSTVLEQTDLNIQNEEECLGYLRDALKGEITYARKASASTDTQHTYILRCRSRVVGSFVIEASREDRYGFRQWEFREDHFDLSELMGTEVISITVPQGYEVRVNGVTLNDSYIVDEQTRKYAILEEFYGSYELPEMVLQTYQAGPFLNVTFEIEAFDPEGNPFLMDESFDENVMIRLGDETVKQELDQFLEAFIGSYVLFSGCANDNPYGNYAQVMHYVVPDSKLAKHMREALDGLIYAKSKGDEVADIFVNHYISLSEGSYLCDVTYKVDTIGQQGLVQTTSNAKILIVRSGDALLVESMIGY